MTEAETVVDEIGEPFAESVARTGLVALGLPVLLAPVGLVALPIGGLQVVHLAAVSAVVATAAAAAAGVLRSRPPLVLTAGACFVAAMFASTVVGSNPLASLRVSTNYLLGLCLAVCVGVVVRGSSEGLRRLLVAWTLGATALVVPALPSALRASGRFSGSLVSGRVQGTFAQPNDFGEFAVLGVVAAGALLLSARYAVERLLAVLGLAVCLGGVAVSFSRGAWLGAIAALLAVVILSPRLRAAVVAVAGVVLGVVVVGSALAAPPFPTLVSRFVSLVTGVDSPADDRPVIYAQAVRVFVAHPVLGVGPGRFLATNHSPDSLLIRRTYIHGHSVLLTVAAEVGVVGVLALLGLTVALGVSVLRARARLLDAAAVNENARLAVLAAGLVGIAVHGLVDVVYTNPLLISLAWFLTGAVAGAAARALDRHPWPAGDQLVVVR